MLQQRQRLILIKNRGFLDDWDPTALYILDDDCGPKWYSYSILRPDLNILKVSTFGQYSRHAPQAETAELRARSCAHRPRLLHSVQRLSRSLTNAGSDLANSSGARSRDAMRRRSRLQPPAPWLTSALRSEADRPKSRATSSIFMLRSSDSSDWFLTWPCHQRLSALNIDHRLC